MQASARNDAGTWGRRPLPHARSAQGEHRHSINRQQCPRPTRASVPFTPPFHTAAIPQPSTIPAPSSLEGTQRTLFSANDKAMSNEGLGATN
eukprot:3527805-Prymnesium_polylepis.1